MLKDRDVLLRIDDIMSLFKDYLPVEDIPNDAQAISLRFHPVERKLAIVAESVGWKHGEAPLAINFHTRRVYSAGG